MPRKEQPNKIIFKNSV